MANVIVLALLLFFVQLGIGGGLYEALVVYPRWKHYASPGDLPQKLRESGQSLAARFWVLPSLGATLMSILNIFFAWQHHNGGRWAWLTTALIILVNRIITFSYFVPTLSRFHHSKSADPMALRRSVTLWTTLSPMRIGVELVALGFGMVAMVALR